MDIVKHHFETEAMVFDTGVVKTVPRYGEMIQTVVNMIPFPKDSAISIMDVGTGTGNLAYLLKSAFSNSKLVCLDLAENMLDEARKKLKRFSGVEYVLADASAYKFDRKYDVIASSLTLHHLDNDRLKHDFHNKAFKALNGGGMFINADLVIAPEEKMQDVNMSVWQSFILKSSTPEYVEDRHRRYLSEDRPAVLLSELNSLKKAGFKYVDIFWKYYNFAVYGGKKA